MSAPAAQDRTVTARPASTIRPGWQIVVLHLVIAVITGLLIDHHMGLPVSITLLMSGFLFGATLFVTVRPDLNSPYN